MNSKSKTLTRQHDLYQFSIKKNCSLKTMLSLQDLLQTVWFAYVGCYNSQWGKDFWRVCLDFSLFHFIFCWILYQCSGCHIIFVQNPFLYIFHPMKHVGVNEIPGCDETWHTLRSYAIFVESKNFQCFSIRKI